ISQLVLERCLLRGVPAAGVDMSEFARTADELVAFEATLVARCPSAEQPIRTAAGRVEALFVERRTARALTQARALAETASFDVYDLAGHEALTVDTVRALAGDARLSPALAGDTQLPPALAESVSANTVVFPRCTISVSVRKLVELAYGLVNEAALAADNSGGGSGSGLALATAARQAFDVYDVLFPVLHRAELKAPALAWQYFNDCMYAAHHAANLGAAVERMMPDGAGSGERGAWETSAHQLFDAGIAHIAEIERGAARELSRVVAGGSYDGAAQGGRREALAALAERVRRAVAQLCRAAMPPAVAPHVFYSALGRHLDAVIAATVDAVIGVRDIDVDDSQVLSDHCRSIHALTDMFRLDARVLGHYQGLARTALDGVGQVDPLLQADGGAASGDGACAGLATRYCAQASKLAQLADILVISRADILARRRAGLLAQFTVDELVGLVRALFSDTRERGLDIDQLRNMP
ncbi:ribosome biogenesis protein ytm1, partial [Coemansia biformis]